jgi:rod shape-determining protein MreD
MNLIVKNIIRLFWVLFIQVFILKKIPPLHGMAIPYFYFILILWLPYKISRSALLIYAFFLGIIVDIFYKTPGLHSAASLLLAYLRPFVVNLLLPKESTEWGENAPTRFTMGFMQYFTYVVFLTIVHNAYLIFLEWMQFGNFLYFTGKLLVTTFISLLLILISEMPVNRKTSYR